MLRALFTSREAGWNRWQPARLLGPPSSGRHGLSSAISVRGVGPQRACISCPQPFFKKVSGFVGLFLHTRFLNRRLEVTRPDREAGLAGRLAFCSSPPGGRAWCGRPRGLERSTTVSPQRARAPPPPRKGGFQSCHARCPSNLRIRAGRGRAFLQRLGEAPGGGGKDHLRRCTDRW